MIIPEKDQIVTMLILTATAADLLISDMDFLSDLNRFLAVSSDFFW